MRNLPRLYKIRRGPVLHPGASMNQQAGIGIWPCNATKKAQKKEQDMHRSATSTGKVTGTKTWRLLIRHWCE
jgi:hypothetical protein